MTSSAAPITTTVLCVVKDFDIDGSTQVIRHRYDNAKRLRRTVYPDGGIRRQGWTDRNQLKRVTYNGDLIARFTYDDGQRETRRRYGNGVVTNRTYRADNLLHSITAAGVIGFTYDYDANKRKTSVTDAALSTWTQQFSYDDEDRLTDWNRVGGDSSNATTNQLWNLSLVGDWHSTNRDGTIETRQHNAVHEILSSQQGTDPAQALSHDDKGNLTANPDRLSTYTWDFDNRMASATVDGDTTTYRYDALGRRVQKTVTASGGAPAEVTTYICAGAQVLSELKNASHSVSYVYGSYVDEALAIIDHQNSNAVSYLHADHRYSVAARTDATGALQQRYAYDAYGERTKLTAGGAPDNNTANTPLDSYGHTGRRHDGETGLQYFRARYYDAVLGRFCCA